MHLDELRKYYRQVQVSAGAAEVAGWYVAEWEKFERCVG